jgi:hypothetical protein
MRELQPTHPYKSCDCWIADHSDRRHEPERADRNRNDFSRFLFPRKDAGREAEVGAGALNGIER